MKENQLKSNFMSASRKVFQVVGAQIIALAILWTILGIASNVFFTKLNMMTLFNLFTANCVLSFGVMCCIVAGEFDLSVGSQIAVAGIILCMIMNAGGSFFVALLGAIGVCMVIGAISGVVIALTGMPSFVVTLAMMGAIRGLAYILSGGTNLMSDNETFYQLTAGRLWGLIPYTTIIVFVLAVIMDIMFRNTKLGKYIFACGSNREAAIFSGINDKKVVIIVYIICSAFAGISGTFVASRVTSGIPTAGQNYEGDAICAVVLGGTAFAGGKGNVWGVVMGSLILGTLSNGMNLLELSYNWQMILKGVLIMLAVMVDTIKERREKSAA